MLTGVSERVGLRQTGARATVANAGVDFLRCFAATALICFGVVWVFVATAPMAFLSRDYPLWIAKRTMLDECRLGTVSVFGDSRTLAAIAPEAMPMPVSNFALSGTSPLETYFAVRRALRCPNLPKLVVIAHGPLKFMSDSDYWRFSARTGFLDYADMREVDADAARLGDDEITRLAGGDQLPQSVREALFTMRFPAFYFDSLMNGYIAARWRHNLAAMQAALASSGHALFGTAAGSDQVAADGLAGRFAASPLMDLYFSRTVALLAQRGVAVVALSMPVNQATFERMRPEIRQDFAAYLQGKAHLQAVGPISPCWPDRYFGDAWHFNAEGAASFSAMLGGWLQKRLDGDDAGDLPGRCVAAG